MFTGNSTGLSKHHNNVEEIGKPIQHLKCKSIHQAVTQNLYIRNNYQQPFTNSSICDVSLHVVRIVMSKMSDMKIDNVFRIVSLNRNCKRIKWMEGESDKSSCSRWNGTTKNTCVDFEHQ